MVLPVRLVRLAAIWRWTLGGRGVVLVGVGSGKGLGAPCQRSAEPGSWLTVASGEKPTVAAVSSSTVPGLKVAVENRLPRAALWPRASAPPLTVMLPVKGAELSVGNLFSPATFNPG